MADQPLRICIASGTFHPDSGGPPTYLLALGKALVERGHAVHVVTYGEHAEPYRYPYPVTRIRRGRRVPSRLALFVREVPRHGRSADLLYVNDYGLPAMVANLVLRKPLVMKIVGDFAWEYSVRHGLVAADEPIDRFQQRRYGPKVELVRWMQATYARRADRIIVPSRYVARYVAGWGVAEDRIRVIENAVADPTYGLTLDQRGARQALGLPLDGPIILTIARLTPWKGIDTLIAALPAIRDAVPGTTLVVVGDGPDRGRLERLAAAASSGSVLFAGEAPHSSIGRYQRAASVFALLSGYEGLSHVLLEAMAAGTPVVASAMGGNLDLVEDGSNGLLVPYRDVPATASAMIRMLIEPGLATRLAATGRDESAERTLERLVDRTVGVFREAIAMHRSRGSS